MDMNGPFNSNKTKTILFILFFSLYSINNVSVTAKPNKNPFTTTAFLDRYWNNHISNNNPKPQFLFSKASSLSPIDSAKLVNSLSKHNYDSVSLCSLPNFYCPFDSSQKPNTTQDANFTHYSNKNFANYGIAKLGGVDSFKNYSDSLNTPNESFKTYTRSSNGHREGFTSYGKDGNVAMDNFTSYGASSIGGSGEFDNYEERVNIPNLRFTSYNAGGAKNHKLRFTSYSDDTNAGSEGFVSYAKNGKSAMNEFTQYGHDSNTIGSSFNGYGELENAGNDSFKGYGDSGNNPHNSFKNYGSGEVSGIENFVSYRDGANVGVDNFQTYARNSSFERVGFKNYGKTFNLGNSSFKDYGRGSKGRTTIDFKLYNLDRSFVGYIKKGVTFASYNNVTNNDDGKSSSGIFVNKWVEPGKFFREASFKEGNIMMMPDITDKMPKRSFLPRSISSKLPFSTLGLPTLKRMFQADANSAIERMLINAVAECERSSSPGETKSCVGSIEDMIDFTTSILGRNVVVRTTKNIRGSKQSIMIGRVKGINGGKVTKSVSCHQSMYPYLLYYCHSVPKVKVYEADILDVKNKTLINHGVAICHIDTSAWSPSHAAFVSLGSSPGRIEVCHWIFENDMSWTVNDVY